MLNCVGQEVNRGDYVVQIARTNQGMVKRVGVVLGAVMVDETLRLRTAWYDSDYADTSTMESAVGVENLIKVDSKTLPATTVLALEFAKGRGRASL
jgi:hypothetical protein